MSIDYAAACTTDTERLKWLLCAAEQLRVAHNKAKSPEERKACLDKQKIVLCQASRYRDKLGLNVEAKEAEAAALKVEAATAPAYVADIAKLDPVADKRLTLEPLPVLTAEKSL